jgi:hypothetical protein
MRKTWRLEGLTETCVIAPRSYVNQEEQGAYLSAQLDRWLADPLSRQTLLDIYESLRGASAALARRTAGTDVQRYVKTELLEAFRRGELVVLRMPHVSVFPTVELAPRKEKAVAEEQPPGAAEQPPPSEKKKTWVEVELVDQDGDPVPDVQYRVELPDGTTKTGKLGANGRARVSDIDPGTCKVSFPGFDASEWEAA